MSRFEAIGHFVYEKGDRIGVTLDEGAIELARKLNAYQMRIERLKAQVERLTKAGDNMYSWLGVCGRHNNSTGDDWLRAKKGLPSLTEQWEIEKRNRVAENAAKDGKQS